MIFLKSSYAQFHFDFGVLDFLGSWRLHFGLLRLRTPTTRPFLLVMYFGSSILFLVRGRFGLYPAPVVHD